VPKHSAPLPRGRLVVGLDLDVVIERRIFAIAFAITGQGRFQLVVALDAFAVQLVRIGSGGSLFGGLGILGQQLRRVLVLADDRIAALGGALGAELLQAAIQIHGIALVAGESRADRIARVGLRLRAIREALLVGVEPVHPGHIVRMLHAGANRGHLHVVVVELAGFRLHFDHLAGDGLPGLAVKGGGGGAHRFHFAIGHVLAS
jgi:hypothetical protein